MLQKIISADQTEADRYRGQGSVVQMDLNLKLFHMNRLGIPQDRIAKRLGAAQASIHYHLSKMAALPNLINSDLERDFTATQVA